MDEREEFTKLVKQTYERDTAAMILVFAQWCVNHQLDAASLYQQAYPHQKIPSSLEQMMAITVPKEEAGEIPTDTLLSVLLAFDNESLAEVVQQYDKRAK
ncbi:hypothetical protein PP175_04910 [Aneurinibacillus sp. Ricciae_BoGa-3]|uniref:hypothetical protein n=1 Tax=Aneurinibacillus sp. Ricciae_BoGa-3 TaxID=3022697 RepID=UPI0023427AE2|nr:hypothetical protein [Aneurinibacillus sp. Ricciae_BoGa-3]WCK55322.1 hypothetical protein PP175_04910 [Aneurinibacillus sp. Ricciae_BoGa-3]